MSWRDAPLYIEAHDLSVQVLARARAWDEPDRRLLGEPACTAAWELLSAVGSALTFPESRARHLQTADESLLRLRLLLRAARDTGLVSGGWHRQATGRLRAIGRMIGGWKKRRSARAPPSP